MASSFAGSSDELKKAGMHNRDMRKRGVACAVAALVSALAQAQQVDKDAPVATVEIAGSASAYDARREDTAAKIVLDHAAIVKYGDGNVFEVLKRVPGVTVVGTAGRGAEIRMRGLGGGYTQILINGERTSASFSIESLAPDAIEKIEVMRAATADLSTQSIAGTINIILRKSVPPGERELKMSVAEGEGGGLSPRVILQMGERRGQLSYAVNANLYRNNYDRISHVTEDATDAAGQPTMHRETRLPDGGHDNNLSVAPRVNWTFENGDTLSSQSYINLSNTVRPSLRTVTTTLGAPPAYPLVDERVEWGNQSLRSELNWITKLGADAKLDIKLNGMLATLQHDLFEQGYLTAGTTAVLDDAERGRAHSHAWGLTGKYALQLAQGHRLAAGWDGGSYTRDDTRRLTVRGAAPKVSEESFDAVIDRLALFAQDDWTLTPQWSVYLGARWEGIATRVEGSTFAPVQVRSSVWSPLLQTLYKLPGSKADQLRLALTKTYRAPDSSQLIPRLFTTANNSAVELDFEGNPLLKPELAVGLDAAYEHYWADGALFSVSASSRSIDDLIRSETYLAPSGRWTSHPINDGHAHSYGLEIETKFPLKLVFDDAPAMDLRASLSRNWSHVDAAPGPDNRIARQTPLSLNLGADYQRGPLTVGSNFAFRTGGHVQQSITQSTFESARRDLDFYLMWKFSRQDLVRLYASNVLAQASENNRVYTDGTGTLRRSGTYPNKASVRLSWETRF